MFQTSFWQSLDQFVVLEEPPMSPVLVESKSSSQDSSQGEASGEVITPLSQVTGLCCRYCPALLLLQNIENRSSDHFIDHYHPLLTLY